MEGWWIFFFRIKFLPRTIVTNPHHEIVLGFRGEIKLGRGELYR